MALLEVFQDAFPSSFDSTLLLLLSFCFQSSQLGLLLLDIAALRDFKASAFLEGQDVCDAHNQRTQIRENTFRTE